MAARRARADVASPPTEAFMPMTPYLGAVVIAFAVFAVILLGSSIWTGKGR
jgi:hypothetical protein